MMNFDLSDYIKIDTHCHTRPSSLCSQITQKELVDRYVAEGFGAIVLTNHYQKAHFLQYGNNKKDILNGYLEDYRQAVKAAIGTSLKVFLGAEVLFRNDETATNGNGEKGPLHGEFLLFGVSEQFLWDTFDLTDLTQEELFMLCDKEGILTYQSHPFRTVHFCRPLNPNFMHGAEVYNPHIEPNFDLALDFARKNNLLMSSGSDTHSLREPGNSGMYIPKDICNQFELRDYLKSGESIIFDRNGLFCVNGIPLK